MIHTLQAELGKPYELGKTDCHTVMAKAIEAMCGQWPDHGFKYTTLKEAQAILKKNDLFAWLDSHFATERVRPNFQQRGDLIFMAWEGLICSHVVTGEHIVSVDPERGVFKAKLAALPEENLIEIIRIV